MNKLEINYESPNFRITTSEIPKGRGVEQIVSIEDRNEDCAGVPFWSIVTSYSRDSGFIEVKMPQALLEELIHGQQNKTDPSDGSESN